MAQLIRSANSGIDWTANELAAYNITAIYQDFATFFETPNIPQPAINPNVLTTLDHNDTADDDTYKLLMSLDLVMALAPAEESAIDDFVVVLLRALGYEPRGRALGTRKHLPLVVCGENRHAKTDVSLIDAQEIVLLVQEDKQHMADEDPEPHLIAEAIAALRLNNWMRVQTLGTAPIFYKIKNS